MNYMKPDSLNIKKVVEEKKVYSFRAGEFETFFERKGQKWFFYTQKKDVENDPELSDEAVKPEDVNWEVFHSSKSDVLRIVPALPAKPVVFKNSRLFISAGQKITIFLKIPVSFQFYQNQMNPSSLLKEVATKQLSNTWFGAIDTGEPAYSIGSGFSTQPEELNPKMYEAVCPVRIFNKSSNQLEVQRLIIRVNEMALYENKNKLFSSLMEIDFKGSDQVEKVIFTADKNIMGDQYKLLSKPRSAESKNLLKFNFHFVKKI